MRYGLLGKRSRRRQAEKAGGRMSFIPRMGSIRRVGVAFLVLSAPFVDADVAQEQEADPQMATVSEQTDDQLTLEAWTFVDSIAVDISDMDIDDDIDLTTWTFFTADPTEIRRILLAEGLGRLTDESAASDVELEAQAEARSDRIGIWTESPGQIAGRYIGWVLGFLVSSGLLLYGWTTFLKRRRTRRIRLLFIGEKSAGKSGLAIAFTEPSATKGDILSLSPTPALNRRLQRNPMTMGRYEVTGEVADVSGSKPQEILNYLADVRRRVVLVIVLSPCRTNETDGKGNVEQAFVDRQLAYCELLGQAILSSVRTRRLFSLCLVFVGKFDAVSIDPPNAGQGRKAKANLDTWFAPHLAAITQACRASRIRQKTIVGSAADRWGLHEVREQIEASLFR